MQTRRHDKGARPGRSKKECHSPQRKKYRTLARLMSTVHIKENKYKENNLLNVFLPTHYATRCTSLSLEYTLPFSILTAPDGGPTGDNFEE